MGRLATSGFEIYVAAPPGSGDTSALKEFGAPDGYLTGTGGSRATTGQRSGAACFRCNPSAVNCTVTWTFTGALERTYYVRFYIRVATAPSTAAAVIAGFTSGGVSSLQLNTDGTICSTNNFGLTQNISDGLWHCIEWKVKVSATQASRLWEVRVDGVTISSGSGQSNDSSAPTSFYLGSTNSVSCDLYYDDVVLNDDQGTTFNTWPGQSYLLLLTPGSDNNRGSWTGGAGGTTNLWQALDNIPPAGAAAPGTDVQQIRANAVATTGIFDTITYSAAGATSGSRIIGAALYACHGEEVATGTKSGAADEAATTGSDSITFNAFTTGTFNYGLDAGAEGAWPSFWRWSQSTFELPSAQPSSLATSHRIQVRTTTATRVASCCFLGMYVEFGAPKAIVAATINAAGTVTGKVTALHVIRPTTNITASATVSATVGRRYALVPTQITAQSTVSGAVTVRRAIRPTTNIAASSTMSGAVSKPPKVLTVAQINATSTVSGGVARPPKLIVATTIFATSTVKGYVRTPPILKLRINGLYKDFIPPGGLVGVTEIWIDPSSNQWIPNEVVAVPQGSGVVNTNYVPVGAVFDGAFIPRAGTGDNGFYSSVQNVAKTLKFSTSLKVGHKSGSTEPTPPTVNNTVADGELIWSRPSRTYVGTWQPSTAYNINDCISEGNKVFRCTSPGTSDVTKPPTLATVDYGNTVVDGPDITWNCVYHWRGTWAPNTVYDLDFKVDHSSIVSDMVITSGGVLLTYFGTAGTPGDTTGSYGRTGLTEPAWGSSGASGYWRDNEVLWIRGQNLFGDSGSITQHERCVLTGLNASGLADGTQIVIRNMSTDPGTDVVLAGRGFKHRFNAEETVGTDAESVYYFDLNGVDIRLPGGTSLMKGGTATLQWNASSAKWTLVASTNNIRAFSTVSGSVTKIGAAVNYTDLATVTTATSVTSTEIYIPININLNGCLKDYNPPGGIDAANILNFNPVSQDWQASTPVACPQGFLSSGAGDTWPASTAHALFSPSDTTTPVTGTNRGTWVSGTAYSRYDKVVDPDDGLQYITISAIASSTIKPHLDSRWRRSNWIGFSGRSRDAGFYSSMRRTGDATRWFSSEVHSRGTSGSTEPSYTDGILDGTVWWSVVTGTYRGAWAAFTAYATGDLMSADGSIWKCTVGGTSGDGSDTFFDSSTTYNGSSPDGSCNWVRQYCYRGSWTALTEYGFRVQDNHAYVSRDAVLHSGGGILDVGAIKVTDGVTGSTEPAWATASSSLKFWEDGKVIWRFGTFAISDGIAQNERLVLTGLAAAATDGKVVTIKNIATAGTACDVVLADKDILDGLGNVQLQTGGDKTSTHPFSFGGNNVTLAEGQQVDVVYSTTTGMWSAAGTNYTDLATCSTITTPSSVEIHEIPDSATISTATTLSSTEIAAYVDSSTTTTKTTPSATEIHEISDSATVGTTTNLTSTDVAAFVDASTINPITSVSAIEGRTVTDSATATTVTSLTSTEIYAAVDSSIISFTTVPSAISEIREITDAGTVSTKVTVSSTDVAAFVDTQTIATATSVAAAEIVAFTDASTVSSVTSVSTSEVTADTDQATVQTSTIISYIEVAAFVDVQTVRPVTTPSSVETHEIPDTGIIPTITSLTGSTEIAAFVDASTVGTVTSVASVEGGSVDFGIVGTTTTLTSVDLAGYVDSPTIGTTTTPSATDVAAFIDTQITTTITTVISNETYIPLGGALTTDAATVTTTTSLTFVEVPSYVEAGTINTVTNLTSTDVAAYIDSQTVRPVTTPSQTEIHEISDSGTINTTTTLVPSEVAIYTDSAICVMATTVTYTEAHEIPDTNVVTSTTTITTADIAAFVDPATISSTTVVSYSENVGRLDASTVSTTTVPLFSEVAAFADQSTITSVTSIQTVLAFETVDSATVTTATTLSTTDVVAFIDSATLTTVTSVSTIEGQTNIYVDNATVSFSGAVLSSDVFGAVDTDSVKTVSYISATEITSITESATANTVSTVSGVDVAAYLDSAQIASRTSLTAIEFSGAGTQDSATIPTSTNVSYIEIPGYIDVPTIGTSTKVSYTEAANYLDSSIISSSTLAYTSELATFEYVDSATVLTTTTVIAVEFYKITIINLTGEFIFRWRNKFGTRWTGYAMVMRTSEFDLH